MISSPFPHHAIALLRQVGMMGLTPLPLRIRNGKIRSFTSLQRVQTHTPLCHTPSFTHNYVTHHLPPHHLSHTALRTTFAHNFAHTTLSHTIFHTQLCTHNFVTHHLPPHHLSHTTLHTPSFTTPSFTHNFVTTLHTHTQLCHTPSFTSLCLAGVALGDIHHHFVWQAWHLVTSTFVSRSRCGTYGTGLALVAQLCHNFARAHTHTQLCHTPSFTPLCVAGMALADIHLRFAWQAWHLVTSNFVSRGRPGTW